MLSRHWIAPCLAAALAVGTALQCHIGNAAEAVQGGWLPALLYGAMLWFWWAAVWSLLWLAGRRWPELWSSALGSTCGAGVGWSQPMPSPS